jgi:sensor histidine kinase YesM
MNSPLHKIRTWYAALEARKLAALPPDAREEILAFDRSVRRYRWRWIGAAIAVWFLAASTFRFLATDTSWREGLLVSFALLAATTVALTSVWFGHYKFRFSLRGLLAVLSLAVIGAMLGGVIGRIIRHGSIEGPANDFSTLAGRVAVAGLVAGLVYALLMFAVLQLRRRTLQIRNEALTRQAQQDRTARQLADTRLKLMQAQVEPHFLFNTLASVQDLAEGKAPEAAALTRQLIAFLRAGLAGLRDDTTTLAREFDMAAAFLAIMKTRMGDRLSFELHLPDELADESVPPAMLISLVENAIKHGLEPALDGGRMTLSARRDGCTLTVEVSDTGLGLGTETTDGSGGLGLTNIRERLAAIYADDATLSVRENSPHGVVATLSITTRKPVAIGPKCAAKES